MAFLRSHMPFTTGWTEANNNEEEANRHVLVPAMPRWKQYARIILPHIGLVLLSFCYVVGGALVFYKMERPYEVATRRRGLQAIGYHKEKMLTDMWIYLHDGTPDAELVHLAEAYVDNVTRALFEAFDTHYINADHINDDHEDGDYWTVITALFFTTTLLTTIGYGNLVPVTWHGRMFCIIYALFGVPLILITVADIGKYLSEHITWLYHTWRTGNHDVLHNQSEDRNKGAAGGEDKMNEIGYVSIPVTLILAILLGYMCIGAVLLSSWEAWDFFSGFYFSFITMTTVGFGDIVPVNKRYYFIDLCYIIIGLAITTMCIDLVGIQYIRKIHYFGRAIKDARYALVNVGGRMVHVPDLMRYASVLQQKYGKKHADTIIRGAYAPKDLSRIRFIDYTSMASCESIATLISNLCGSSDKYRKDDIEPEDV